MRIWYKAHIIQCSRVLYHTESWFQEDASQMFYNEMFFVPVRWYNKSSVIIHIHVSFRCVYSRFVIPRDYCWRILNVLYFVDIYIYIYIYMCRDDDWYVRDFVSKFGRTIPIAFFGLDHYHVPIYRWMDVDVLRLLTVLRRFRIRCSQNMSK